MVKLDTSKFLVGSDEKGLIAQQDIPKCTFIHITHVQRDWTWINITPNCLYNHSKINENSRIRTVENEYGVKFKELITLEEIKKGGEILVDYTKDSDLEQPQKDWKE